MKKFIFFIVVVVLALGVGCLPAMASPGAELAISIEPAEVKFGTIIPGVDASGDIITIANTGSKTVSVTAQITEDTGFYGNYLHLDGMKAESWIAIIASGGRNNVPTKLEGVPTNLEPGSYTCTVIFWAEVQ